MNLAGLIGSEVAELERRLGVPDARREVGDDRWLIYRRDEATLRVRCVADGSGARDVERSARPDADAGRRPPADGEQGPAGGGGGTSRPRVASWTVTWEEPRPTLRRAVEPLGLWPDCAPDVEAAAVEKQGGRMVRRALPDPSGAGTRSLTAGVAGGGFDRVAAFDEPPEWT